VRKLALLGERPPAMSVNHGATRILLDYDLLSVAMTWIRTSDTS
jgi:hypothetical protein